MSKYQVVRELGCNREGGRITYLSTDTSLAPPQQVVIKEFRFATTDANWSGFKAYEREIEILQQLEHPRIPRYLESYETQSGFCLVQEYKDAPSLAERCSFTPEDIKKIALSVLEILVYLQQRVPPVIHRDIKPENILVDEQLNAYVVDFGFARFRGGELAMSSVAAGTPGFMPPEEQFGRTLTEASDLYSLGATLMCLLTGTRSVEVGNLIDDNYRFDFKTLLPQLSPSFILWLEKMVAANVTQRYANAADALLALQPIRVVGSATGVESLVALIKRTKSATFLGLATLVIAGLGINWMSFRQVSPVTQVPQEDSRVTQVPQQVSPVTHLMKTKQCQECNLEGANLESANLESANLEGANLKLANLKLANLKLANLERAYLGGVNLESARPKLPPLDPSEGADLEGADLEGANLKDAYLWRANLKSADLGRADLGRAKLQDANLKDANLKDANLKDANLGRADLQGANLKRANLGRADLGLADLRTADLRRANLRSASLGSVNLSYTNLANANLSDTNLGNAKLQGANLAGAYLWGTNLQDANLQDANLQGAKLGGADLRDANLQSSNLQGAKLGGADLRGANLKDAIMPDGTKHE